MAVPFALGKVIDLIYTSDPEIMKQNLDRLTITLFCIFLFGGACNFGRVYLMNISGKLYSYYISIYGYSIIN